MTILLCFGIIVVAILLIQIFSGESKKSKESFYGGIKNGEMSVQPNDPSLVSIVNSASEGLSCPSLDDYVKKTDVGLAAKAAALEYCPVSPDYDPSQYIKKSEIKSHKKECPKQPDMKDYVLKSSIPPQQECPACVCPKVDVPANMCKKCPPLDKSLCPKPEPCTKEQCEKVVQCSPNEKPCPLTASCPAPKPCPTQPTQVCPAIKIEKQKCPAPAPCPAPPPCPQVQRCERVQAPSCKYYGVTNVYSAEDLIGELNDLIDSSDPAKQALLAQAKKLVNTRLSQQEEQQLIATQQSQIASLKNELAEEQELLKQKDDQINLNSNESAMKNYLGTNMPTNSSLSRCNRDQELINLNLN